MPVSVIELTGACSPLENPLCDIIYWSFLLTLFSQKVMKFCKELDIMFFCYHYILLTASPYSLYVVDTLMSYCCAVARAAPVCACALFIASSGAWQRQHSDGGLDRSVVLLVPHSRLIFRPPAITGT